MLIFENKIAQFSIQAKGNDFLSVSGVQIRGCERLVFGRTRTATYFCAGRKTKGSALSAWNS